MLGSSLKITDRAISFLTFVMIFLFIFAMTIFIRNNSHFIGDDFDHFGDIVVKSLPELLATRIDVHFVPFHQLATYLIFHASPLNFDVALGVMVAGWIAGVALLYLVLRRLAPRHGALLIVLVIATSPAWLHILIWWSAAAHRVPYLLLQAAACLAYLRYRENHRGVDALLCLIMQVVALGFYVKAILFPFVLVAIEICLYFFSKRFSRNGVWLCIGMLLVSAFYVGWYLVFSPVVRVGNGLEAVDTIKVALHFIFRFGALLLFLPIDQLWSEWVSGIFWGTMACWSAWRSPRSMLPIAALLAILFVSFVLTVAGRGAIVSFPFAAMRYYSDELFVVGIFSALVMAAHADPSIKLISFKTKNYLTFAFVAVLALYPVGAYFSSRSVFSMAYEQHRLTHDFMVNLENSFRAESEKPSTGVVLSADFPPFIYGFLGARKPMADILGSVYPRIKWLSRPNRMIDDVYQVGDSGRLEVAVLSDSPDFKNNISFPDWSGAEETHRWSSGYHAVILFSLRPDHKYEGELLIRGPVLGVQRVTVRLNDVPIANINLSESIDCCSWSVRFSPDLLRSDGLNIFEFDLPDARKPGNGDPRILAIGVQAVQVR